MGLFLTDSLNFYLLKKEFSPTMPLHDISSEEVSSNKKECGYSALADQKKKRERW